MVKEDKNYIMYKRGYKYMLDDLEEAKRNISKFKRGLSIFEDKDLREKLLSNTAAPVISIQNLRSQLQDVVLKDKQEGPQLQLINSETDYNDPRIKHLLSD